jgi:hypothetical protein
MMRIGLIAEDTYDVGSINALLKKKYTTVQFKHILPRVKGAGLKSHKTRRSITAEFKTSGCAFIVFMVDLDGLATQRDLINEKQTLFDSLNALCGSGNLLLLNIWELEAMIFGDIDVFNKKYGTNLSGDRNPMFISDPKGELISATYRKKKRFEVSDCPEIFAELGFDHVKAKCKFFSDFVDEFDKRLQN